MKFHFLSQFIHMNNNIRHVRIIRYKYLQRNYIRCKFYGFALFHREAPSQEHHSLSNLSQNMYNFKSLLTYINIVINIDMCAYYYQYLRTGAHRSIYRASLDTRLRFEFLFFFFFFFSCVWEKRGYCSCTV